MYSDDDLTSAVEAGAISADAAAALRAYVSQKRATNVVDEENFRLVTSFNDVFVTIACVLLLLAIAWLFDAINRPVGYAFVAATAWGLAEFFTRKRRMALPSILLLLTFVGAIFGSAVTLFGQKPVDWGIAAALAAAAAWLHWRRFHVPITVAAGAAAVVVLAFALMFSAIPEHAGTWTNVIAFISGVAILVLALRWDMSDRLRQTRKSDVAFWLHVLAAPLLVHPVFVSVGIPDAQIGLVQGAAVVILYLGLCIASLLIDRRALLVSALVYVLHSLNALLEKFGLVNQNAALTALIIGSALLLLAAFWHPARAMVMRRLPARMLAALPPLGDRIQQAA